MLNFCKRLIIIIFLFISTLASAQQLGNFVVNKAGDTIIIQAIPTLEINTKLEELNTNLKKFKDALKPSPEIYATDSLVKGAKEYLEQQKQIIYGGDDELSFRGIDDSKREWQGYENEIGNWQSTLSNKISDIDKNIFDLSVLINTWQTTSKKAQEEKLPLELITRLGEVIKLSKSFENKFKKKLDSLYILQNTITDYQISIDEVLDFLNEKRIAMQSDYFVRDCNYLWKSGDSTIRIKNAQTQIRTAFDQNKRSIELFFETNSSSANFHIFISILLFILFYYLYTEFKKKEIDTEDTRLLESKYFLTNYFASGLLVVLMASFFIYSNMPAAIREIVQLLLLIPAILLIKGYADIRLRPIIYSLVLLFFIDELQILLDAKSLIARVALILECFIILWILLQIVKKKTTLKEIFRPKWRRFTIRFSNFLILVAVISLICNVLGYVNLSSILINAIVSILLGAVILVLAVKVMLSMVVGLLNSKYFQLLNIVRNHRVFLLNKASSLFIYAAIFFWIRSTLISLGLIDQVGSWLSDLYNAKWNAGTIDISFAHILGFIIVIFITYFASKGTKYLLEEELFPRIKLPRGVPGAISMLIRYIIVAFGIFISLSVAGIKLNNFSLIAGALGVGIGFGLQGVVYNFIAGLILAFERPIQKGDTIEVGTLFGDVLNIGVRASTVKTYDGSEVIVPNGNLISNELKNWTLSDRKKRREIKVGVAYGNDPRRVMELLAKVAGEHRDVLFTPKPWPLFEGFGQNSLEFRILFWTNLDKGLTIKSEVAMNIYDALRDAGIHIPFPQTDLHIKSFDPTIQKTIIPFVKDQKEKGNKDELNKSEN